MSEREPCRGSTAERAAWYRGGLRFECREDCGACCRDHGEYAWVYLLRRDVERLSAYLGSSPADFVARYTALDDGSTVLRSTRPECPFLDGSRCAVYPARPTQCRTFPFWTEHVKSESAWRQVREFCPGVDEGPCHGPDEIERSCGEPRWD